MAGRDWAHDPPPGFDWSAEKYFETIAAHDIRFEIAILVFGDPYRIEVYDDRDDYGEDRFYAIGSAVDRIIRVAFTLRGEHDQTTRIITAFKATTPERRRYERSRKGR